jgi:hypothetical protein
MAIDSDNSRSVVLFNGEYPGTVGFSGKASGKRIQGYQYNSDGSLRASRYDPDCFKKECDEKRAEDISGLIQTSVPYRKEDSLTTFPETTEEHKGYEPSPSSSQTPYSFYGEYYHHFQTNPRRFVQYVEEIIYVEVPVVIPNEEKPTTEVPEPSSLVLSILGLGALLIYRRKGFQHHVNPI